MKVLIGNSFPLALMRRARVEIICRPLAELLAALKGAEVVSFWGHENTRAAAEAVLGVSLRTESERPALTLSDDGYPSLDGYVFKSCWVLSPNYPKGFRPSIGAEVDEASITGWQPLKVSWY